MKVHIEVVDFTRPDVDIVIIVLVLAGSSDERIGFRLHDGGCICAIGNAEVRAWSAVVSNQSLEELTRIQNQDQKEEQ